jgi:hypothetical protein
MTRKAGPTAVRWAWRAAAAIVLVAAALVVFFPHATLDRFLARRITRAIEKSWPGHTARIGALRYEIAANRIVIDSLTITRSDTALSLSVTKLLVWDVPRFELLWSGGASPSALGRTSVDARGVVLMFPNAQYVLRCARAGVEGADSTARVDSLELRAWPGDDVYFAASPFRRTRFELLLPAGAAAGIDVRGIVDGSALRARTVTIDDAGLAVFINKDLPFDPEAPPPLTPMDLLALAGRRVSFDTIQVANGRMTYSERHTSGAAPAVLSVDSVDARLTGMRTQGGRGDSALFVVHGVVMQEGRLDMRVAVPLDTPGPAFRASGTVGRMHFVSLNPFLVVAEQARFKTGVVHAVAFEVVAGAGAATGTVRAAYEDLKVVALDQTGSEKGIANRLMSILANNVKLRTTNLADDSGAMKIGTIRHARADDEAFLEYAWFSVRSGLKDIVGF